MRLLKYTNGRLVKTVGAKLMWGTVTQHCSVLPSTHTHKQPGRKWSNFLHFVLEVFYNGRSRYQGMRGTFWKSGHQDLSGSVYLLTQSWSMNLLWYMHSGSLEKTWHNNKMKGSQKLGNILLYNSQSIYLPFRIFAWRVLHRWWWCTLCLLPQTSFKNHLV